MRGETAFWRIFWLNPDNFFAPMSLTVSEEINSQINIQFKNDFVK